MAGSYHRLLKLATNKDHSVVPCLVDIGIAQRRFTISEVDALDEVHRDVNHLKHRPRGLLSGRRVSDPELAVRAANQAIVLFEKVA